MIPTRVMISRGACLISAALAASSVFAQTLNFTNVAREAGVDILHTVPSGGSVPMAGGGAVGDFNNDGWQDLFVLVGGGAPDALFINNGDGTFTDQAPEWGVAFSHLGLGAAVGDYNNDGWLDIFVTSFGPGGVIPGQNLLYRNNGNGTFTNVATEMGVDNQSSRIRDGYGAAFGDYDLDGDLDLMVASWGTHINVLYRNDGVRFTEVTLTAIDRDLSDVLGFSPRFVDMNGDRYPELLLTGDFDTSKYFINNRDGTFTEATAAAGVGQERNGMGQTIGDFNGDGFFDWYVTNICCEAADPFAEGRLGNMLYVNRGDGTFDELGEQAGVYDGAWGWGASAVDLNLDGLLDIVETNGWVNPWRDDMARVFLNRGNLQFDEVADQVGIRQRRYGRGLLNFDYDLDGDQDIVIFAFQGRLHLYRNDLTGPSCNGLRVLLDTSARPDLAPNGIGTRLVAVYSGTPHYWYLEAGSNYLSQSELSAHFGLAGATQVDELRIEWSNGKTTVLHDVAANQTLTVSARLDGDIDGNRRVDLADLAVLLSSFSTCSGDEGFLSAADVNDDGCVNLSDLESLLIDFGLSR